MYGSLFSFSHPFLFFFFFPFFFFFFFFFCIPAYLYLQHLYTPKIFRIMNMSIIYLSCAPVSPLGVCSGLGWLRLICPSVWSVDGRVRRRRHMQERLCHRTPCGRDILLADLHISLCCYLSFFLSLLHFCRLLLTLCGSFSYLATRPAIASSTLYTYMHIYISLHLSLFTSADWW